MGISKSSGSAAVRDRETGDTAQVSTKTNSKKGLEVIAEIDGIDFTPGTKFPVQPADDVVYQTKFLLNGSSKQMAVDGDPTAQEFEFLVGSGEVFFAESLQIYLSDFGTPDEGDFGSIAGGLSNGVLIEFRTQSSTFEYANLQDNLDVAMAFPKPSFGDTGWFSTGDFYLAQIDFKVPMKLSQGDFIRFTIRDDIDGLNSFYAACKVWSTL
jgi:hypothetical protein